MSKKSVTATAISALVAFSVCTASVFAADKPEKCYGIVKAGKNDCQTANNACAGHAGADQQRDARVYLPKGVYEKIVGANLAAK